MSPRDRRNGWFVSPWSPYAAGALLGVLSAISVAIAGRTLGASAAYEHLVGFLGARLSPQNVYWHVVATPSFGWTNWLLVGVALGAFVASLAGRTFRLRTIPDEQWAHEWGSSRVTRWVLAFVGAAMIEFAAGIAGGCTSGLAVSGGVVLAPAAFVFMMAMFAGGIPTAWFVDRLAARRGHREKGG